jgi:hypothetical protein
MAIWRIPLGQSGDYHYYLKQSGNFLIAKAIWRQFDS